MEKTFLHKHIHMYATPQTEFVFYTPESNEGYALSMSQSDLDSTFGQYLGSHLPKHNGTWLLVARTSGIEKVIGAVVEKAIIDPKEHKAALLSKYSTLKQDSF